MFRRKYEKKIINIILFIINVIFIAFGILNFISIDNKKYIQDNNEALVYISGEHVINYNSLLPVYLNFDNTKYECFASNVHNASRAYDSFTQYTDSGITTFLCDYLIENHYVNYNNYDEFIGKDLVLYTYVYGCKVPTFTFTIKTIYNYKYEKTNSPIFNSMILLNDSDFNNLSDFYKTISLFRKSFYVSEYENEPIEYYEIANQSDLSFATINISSGLYYKIAKEIAINKKDLTLSLNYEDAKNLEKNKASFNEIISFYNLEDEYLLNKKLLDYSTQLLPYFKLPCDNGSFKCKVNSIIMNSESIVYLPGGIEPSIPYLYIKNNLSYDDSVPVSDEYQKQIEINGVQYEIDDIRGIDCTDMIKRIDFLRNNLYSEISITLLVLLIIIDLAYVIVKYYKQNISFKEFNLKLIQFIIIVSSLGFILFQFIIRALTGFKKIEINYYVTFEACIIVIICNIVLYNLLLGIKKLLKRIINLC